MKNRELFEIFLKERSTFDLYNNIEILIEKQIKNARGEENANFYQVLCQLSNSINNAGWEDRHDDQISSLNKTMGEISDKYEDYLP